jgi:guanosine-diphosphatase
MNHGQRTRYLKAGGLIAVVLFIFFFLAPGERQTVEKYVGGKCTSSLGRKTFEVKMKGD